ncbi:hypothetical protein GW931_00310 [archaeon]|nr:hypothetical protein [archaeon]PJC45532.1 MAG: hypothetical protein CO037_00990 [Candidatus Pacearchaeota archaeon CG_4_9_14_0_2_um_filter_30_8]
MDSPGNFYKLYEKDEKGFFNKLKEEGFEIKSFDRGYSWISFPEISPFFLAEIYENGRILVYNKEKRYKDNKALQKKVSELEGIIKEF